MSKPMTDDTATDTAAEIARLLDAHAAIGDWIKKRDLGLTTTLEPITDWWFKDPLVYGDDPGAELGWPLSDWELKKPINQDNIVGACKRRAATLGLDYAVVPVRTSITMEKPWSSAQRVALFWPASSNYKVKQAIYTSPWFGVHPEEAIGGLTALLAHAEASRDATDAGKETP